MSLFSKLRHFTTKLILNWLNPEPDRSGQGTNVTKASSENHIPVVYGTREVGGTIVFMNTTNPDDGDDVKNDLLHLIVVWCEGGIDGVEDLWLNKISINDSKFDAKDGGRWAHAVHFPNGMGNYTYSYLKEAGWDAASKNHKLQGLACSYIRLEWSIADDAPFTGVPDLTAIIRGKKVKNLHTGAVEYSENPAYILHDYLTASIYGKELAASEIYLQSFKDAATVCDTLVPQYQGASETQKLFTCNQVIDTAQSILDNVELLGKSMRGIIPIINGQLHLIIEQDEPVTPEGLSEREFKSKIQYSSGGKNKRYNRVIVEYIDKEALYSEQDAIYPEPDSELEQQWLNEDNGVLLEHRFKVSGCTNYYEARQMARVIAMLSRESINFTVTANPIALQYTVGDIVPISVKKLGWDEKPFRLIKSNLQDNGDYKLTFKEHQPYIYNWLSGVIRPPIPDSNLPNPRQVAAPTELTATALDDGHVKISWVSAYTYFDVQIYRNNTLIKRTVTPQPEYIITDLDAGSFEIDIRARSNMGYHSEFVTLSFDVLTPGEPIVSIDSATYNTLVLSARVLGAGLGTTFEWQFLGTNDNPRTEVNTHSGYNYTFTGLQPDTEYNFKVRTKNVAGVSPWVAVSASTTVADFAEYIADLEISQLSQEAQNLISDINQQVDRLRPETENNLPSLIAKNIDAITGLTEKVQVIDAENPNNLQQQLADSNSKISDLERVTEVLDATKNNSLPALIKINQIAIESQRLEQQDFGLTLIDVSSAYTNWRNEYERRAFNNERLIDAAVYVDPDSGTIVNRAYAYTDESFNSAQLLIEGAESKITLNAKQIAQSQNRITQAEATLKLQAGQITQRATFSEVESKIAGALAALQPAYSWQFNTGVEGFTGVDSHHAQGYIVATSQIVTPTVSFDASENPMFRIRVRKHTGSTWKGDITFNGGATLLHLREPTTDDWETLTLDATGTAGYEGTITSLAFDLGACDIDSIEVGKRGANDLALADITARTTTIEQDINARTGIMAQYATTAWVNALGFQTQSNVQALIDSFNTTYGISAVLQEFNDNDTVVKANIAKSWVDGANATIRNQVTSILNSEDGITDTLTILSDELNALAGQITQSITSIDGLAERIDLQELTDLELLSYIEENDAILALANQKLSALSDDVDAIATETLDLITQTESQAATLNQLNQSLIDERQARVQSEQQLRTEIENEGNRAIAQANEDLQAAIGYCVDADGNRVDAEDAVACEAAGHTWVDGAFVERLNNYTAAFINSKGYQTAANVEQFISTFDSQYGITATIQQINDEDIITAAKEAQQWINGAEGTIESLITQYVNKPDGINNTISFAYDLIQANADEISATSQAQQQLSARMADAEADINTFNIALTTEQQARASMGAQLRVEFQTQDLAMLATANEFTRAVTGYCVDAQGNRVDEDDAIACEAAGHSWVDGPAVQRAVEISASWVTLQGFQTQSNVQQSLNTFDATYKVSATLQQFADNDTLQKANNAQQFINGAEAYIAQRITAYNAQEDGVNAKFSDVQERLDAAEGSISSSVVQIQGLEQSQQASDLNAVIAAYNTLVSEKELAELDVKAAIANEKLQAQTTELESLAQQQLDLAALFNDSKAIITSLNQAVSNQYQSSVIRDQRYQATFGNVSARFSDVTTAIATIDEANTVRDEELESFVADTIAQFDEVTETFASQEQAYTELQQTLTAKIDEDTEAAKNAAVSTAQEYTRTAVGYCVNADGQITNENDAVQCVADGGSWVNGPLAEFIANMQISDGDSSASIKQLRQLFTTVDGKLVARGGWTLDNNGRVVGIAGYNDGEVGNLDLVGDVIRQGVMVNGTFVPTSYIDNSDPAKPVHTFKGRLVLGDGHAVNSLEDIKAQDGKDGADGITPTITVNPDGSYTISNGTDSVTIRDGENAPIPTVTDNGDGTYTVTDGSGNSIVVRDGEDGKNGEDGYTPLKGTDYFDGNDGSFVSYVFKAATSKPSTPSGGAFDGTTESFPSGWSDTPVYVNGQITWVSKTRYRIENNAWTKTGWSSPVEYIIKGDKGADGQKGNDGQDGNDGADGSRGSIEVQVATSSGAWSDSVANSSVPGAPVIHDRVTIYKSSDPATQTTKRFNGSSWVSYALQVHGSAIIDETLDARAIRAGSRMESPRIDLIGTNFMKIELASGFGPENLWYWYGPKFMKNGLPDLSKCTRANATEWKDTNGNSFTKGSFIAGSLESSVTTSHLVNNPSRELEITSNGNTINFAVSYSHRRTKYGPTDGGPTSVHCPATQQFQPTSGTLYLERWNGSSWTVIQSKSFSGTYSCSDGTYEREQGTPNVPYIASSSSSKSFTTTHRPGSGYQKYRVRAQVNNFYAVSGVGQYLSLAVSE